MPSPTPERSLVAQLRRRLASPPRNQGRSLHSTGWKDLDELLPEGGLRSGSLVEWLADPGSGAATLLWLMAVHLCPSRTFIAIDPRRECFPPGIARCRVDLQRLLVLQPDTPAETLWALEQSLRSRSAGVVIARLEELSPQIGRRLKLAAEQGGSIGLFLRPTRYRCDPSWADVRGLVSASPPQNQPRRDRPNRYQQAPEVSQPQSPSCPTPVPQGSFARRLQLQLLHVRGAGFQPRTLTISIHDDAHLMPLDSQLAHPAPPGTTARAS